MIREQRIQQQIGDKYKYLCNVRAGAFGGPFGKVNKAERVFGPDDPKRPKNDNPVYYAIKTADNLFSSRAKAKGVLREMRILRLLSAHESIIELVDVVPPRDGLKFSQLSAVFDFMPSNLKEIFRSKQFFSSLHIQFIAYQVML